MPGAPFRSASIQFPDPHFKAKHHKRRVVQPELARSLAYWPLARYRCTTYHSPLSSYHFPLHYLPLYYFPPATYHYHGPLTTCHCTTYHLPIAIYYLPLPLTTYRLLLTSHHPRGANPRRQHRAGRLALRAVGRARARRGDARGELSPQP